MSAVILRGDARHLPLPDSSVDLIVTSPPFWQLRGYTDGGEHYEGQIGSEPTWQEYIAALLDCTREWVRVLKPSGSLFVELGDKYSDRGHGPNRGNGTGRGPQGTLLRQTRGPMEKCLLDLPHRYSIGCVDELGLIKRAEIPWNHVNGLPESVTDRVRRSHSMVFHLVKRPRYYAAVDEIREPYGTAGRKGDRRSYAPGSASSMLNGEHQRMSDSFAGLPLNPLGKLPGSVWDIPEGESAVRVILRALAAGVVTMDEAERMILGDPEPAGGGVWSIPSQPLVTPEWLGISHHAAFPVELPRRIILGWSPPGVCTACGEGRRPVTRAERIPLRPGDRPGVAGLNSDSAHGFDRRAGTHVLNRSTITGYTCACPAPDAPTRPAVVLDPFAGTGTTMLVASAYGRIGIGVDRSAGYCRLAQWRTTDPAERARALGVPKPPPVPAGQASLFEGGAA